MATRDVLVVTGQRLRCGGCNVELEFETQLRYCQLPFALVCPRCQWTLQLNETTCSYFRIPKHNQAFKAGGKWTVKFPGETGELPPADDAFSAIEEEVKKLPPELRLISANDQIKEMSGMMLMLLRMSESIRSKIQHFVDQFLAELECSRGILNNFGENIDPNLFHDFMLKPFMRLPLESGDAVANLYGTILLAPKFYQGVHGIPLGNSDGYTAQLICPYSFLSDQLPPWLQLYLDLPPVVKLRPLKTKIIGESLPVLWEQIPGVEPDTDHTATSPSIRMVGDTIAARNYLVRHGCPGWIDISGGDDFLQLKQDWVFQSGSKWKKAHRKFGHHGRLLFVAPDRDDRLHFAMAAANCYLSKTMLVTDTEITDAEQRKAKPWDKFSAGVTKIDWRILAGHPDLNQFRNMIVEADAPYFPQIVKLLYRFNGRLIVLSADPFFDLWGANTWAPMVYGLCNAAHYYVPRFTKPYAWIGARKKVGENIQKALANLGFVD